MKANIWLRSLLSTLFSIDGALNVRFAMAVQRAIVVLMLTAVVYGCASDELTASREDFESRALALEEEVLATTTSEAVRCAQFNGIEVEELRSYLDGPSAGRPAQIVQVSNPGSLEEIRAYMAEVGYNIVLSSEQVDNVEVAQPSAEDRQTDPEVRRIMDVGPVLDPTTGARVSMGCGQWASESVRALPHLQEAMRERADIEAQIEEYVDSSPEMQRVNSEWSRCMADAGHPGLNDLADATSRAFGNLVRVRNGSLDFDEALATEVELALSDFDCKVAVDTVNRRRAVYDQAHAERTDGSS